MDRVPALLGKGNGSVQKGTCTLVGETRNEIPINYST